MVLKLAASIDMSQLAQLREAVESAQRFEKSKKQDISLLLYFFFSVATQVDDYKHRSVKVRNLPRSASQAQIQQVFYFFSKEWQKVIFKIFNGCGTIEHITPQNQRGEVVIRYTWEY